MTLIDQIAASLGYARKAEIGAGVQAMLNGFPMGLLDSRTDHGLYAQGQALFVTNPWVNLAERTVDDRASTVSWHLEDEEDEEIGAEANPEQHRALTLIEKPQAALGDDRMQMTRRQLWSLTFRHMGLCGNAFWVGNRLDPYGIPDAFMPVNPVRMTPVSNHAGYLIGWKLDAQPHDPTSGYPLELREVWHFTLYPPDWGHWGIGIAEASGVLTKLSELAARQTGGVLATGGRIAGIMMPKPGVEMSDDAWASLVRDMRTINEDPNAAKKNLILKKPMDFTPSAASPRELDLMRMLEVTRDDILGYWGVPKSTVGFDVPSGLNSGATKDRDVAVLWQGSVHARLVPFVEVLQFQLLDRWLALGVTLELEVEEPEFEEEGPKYANASAALSQPLRNRERRAILGLDPFGDPVLDEAVWAPATITQLYTAPDAAGDIPVEEPDPSEVEAVEVPGLAVEKASVGRRPLLALQRQAEARTVPRIKRNVAAVLAAQRTEVASRAKRNAAHLVAHPTDTTVWWNQSKWHKQLVAAIRAEVVTVSDDVAAEMERLLATKATPRKADLSGVVAVAIIRRLAQRVTGMTDTTRDDITRVIGDTVASGLEEGLSIAVIGDMLEKALGDAATFDEYRAEMIARTEAMNAWRQSAIETAREYGVELLEADDGDEDDMCVERQSRDNGWGPGIYTTDQAEAESDIEHPNGTLVWVPYFPELAEEAAKGTITRLLYDESGRVSQIIETPVVA